MTTQEQQIEMLTEKLNVLENESRRILNALHWATKVRLILTSVLLLFVLISVGMFYWLYVDVKTRRIAEVQRLISEQPAEFSEPLTRQLMALAEQEGPHVVDVFREQAQKDSQLYMDAIDAERETLIANLQRRMEDKLASSYSTLLDEQEKLLANEFPVLKDPAKSEIVRDNMEEIYEKIGNRYYVNFLKEELDELADQLDSFPPAEPRQANVPIAELVATEFLQLVSLMLIHSENYQIPEESNDSTEIASPPKAIPSKDVDADPDSKSSNDDKSSETEDDSTDSDAASKEPDESKESDDKEDN